MTSYIRTPKNSTSLETMEYMRVSGPYYIDSSLGAMLIPFTYDNGVLDIADIDAATSYSGFSTYG